MKLRCLLQWIYRLCICGCGTVINALNILQYAFDTNLFRFSILFVRLDGMCHSSIELASCAIKFMKVETLSKRLGEGEGAGAEIQNDMLRTKHSIKLNAYRQNKKAWYWNSKHVGIALIGCGRPISQFHFHRNPVHRDSSGSSKCNVKFYSVQQYSSYVPTSICELYKQKQFAIIINWLRWAFSSLFLSPSIFIAFASAMKHHFTSHSSFNK